MLKKYLFSSLLILPFIFGCTNPSSSGLDSDTTPRSITQLITDFPEIQFNLPKSLQDGSGTLSESRAVGDISSFSLLSDEPGVKADGWYRIHSAASGDRGLSVMLVKILKHLATQVDLVVDEEIVLGVRSFPDGITGPNDELEMDMGTLRIKQITQSKISVFWTVEINSGKDDPVYTYYMNVKIEEFSDGSMKSDTYLILEDQSDPGIFFNSSYGSFNSQTGEVFDFYNDSSDEEYFGMSKLFLDPTGAVQFVERLHGVGFDDLSVAWANDLMGGVAWASEFDWDDGSGEIIHENSLNVEFYDENGFMVKQGWGEAELHPEYMGLNWYDDNSNSYNLYGHLSSVPIGFTVTRIYGNPDSITLNIGSESLNLTGNDFWNFYWKSDSEWSSGDRTYYCTNWEWNEVANSSTATYTTGYTLPTPVNYLGGTYYMNNRFPLRYLILNKEGYTLKNREGDTYVDSWTDEEGSTWSWSWTDYTWWLDNNSTADDPSETTGITKGYELESSDIPLNGSIYLDSYYVWDGEANQSIEQKAYTYLTNEDEPSDLFLFTDVILVNAVKDHLEALYNTSSTLYETKPTDMLNFPDIEKFPKLLK